MSNVHPSPGSYEYPGDPDHSRQLTLFDMILPPQAFPLLALLFVIMPMVLLTGESLFTPLLEWLKSKMMLGNESAFDMLPFHFFLKLGAFLILSFLGAFQLVIRINTSYYSTWARSFPRPHPLHTDYHPHKYHSVNALMRWQLYRAMMIVVPPVVVIGLTALVGLGEFYLFNVLGEFPFISLSIQMTVGIFVMMLLGMFCLFSVLSSVWHIFTTVYGDVIAVTEPNLSAKAVFDRSNRIAFSSPYGYTLYPAYFVMGLIFLGMVAWLLISVDIYQLLHFEANIPLIAGCELLLFILYITFNYFRFYTYHHALYMYYHKLPKQMKEFFKPPA